MNSLQIIINDWHTDILTGRIQILTMPQLELMEAYYLVNRNIELASVVKLEIKKRKGLTESLINTLF